MLDYSYEQMLDYITRVRQALVEIAAERKRIELQEPQLQHTIAHLGDQAQAALCCAKTLCIARPAGLRSALVLIRLIYLFMVRVFGWLALPAGRDAAKTRRSSC